jgi:hypothetical protein
VVPAIRDGACTGAYEAVGIVLTNAPDQAIVFRCGLLLGNHNMVRIEQKHGVRPSTY